ncbi:MAG TPA: polysaccharide biosynthesis tyrosine autokinase [Chitinophaga sp.]
MQHNTNGKYPLMNGELAGAEQEQQTISLRTLVDNFIANWYWFALFVILGIAAAWLFLRYATPTYNINAKILVQDEQKGGNVPGEEVLQQLQIFTNKSNVDNEVEILQSRSLMEMVVRNLQLNISYWQEGRVKTGELFRRVPFIAHWLSVRDSLEEVRYQVTPLSEQKFRFGNDGMPDTERNWGDTIHLPQGIIQIDRRSSYRLAKAPYILKLVSIDAAVTNYQTKLTVSIPNKQVSTIDLQLATAIPEKGEAILNELINAYLKTSVEVKNRIADSTIAFVDNRLTLVSRELTGVEKNIQQFKQANQLADLTEQAKLLINSTGDFSKQLTEQEVKLSVVNTLEQYIGDENNNKRIVPSSLVLQDPTFIALVQKYNNFQVERERLLLSSTPSNPLVQNIDLQLKNLRTDLQSNLASFKSGLQAGIAELRGRSGQLDQKIQQVPAKERVFLDYSRQQAIKQELYLFLLKKREESAISKSSNMAVARIIDPAKSEAFPAMPKRMLTYLVCFMLGIIFPAAFLYLKDLLNRRIRRKQDITAGTPVPILSEVGHTKDHDDVVVGKDTVTPIAEQFRAMRTNLQFLLSGAQEKVILLTSSMSGEGKSFVAMNLAATLALSGRKVVLMELDLRKPKISEKLKLNNKQGFSTYVIGKTSFAQLVQPSGFHENCWVIPSGPVPPNPAELLLLDTTKQLFAELRKQFDYIVIDTAPVGLVTDAQLLGYLADVTLYLVRQGYTFKQQLLLSKELYQQGKLPRMNLVVNDVKAGSGYGYGYGYQYGYNYGYANEHANKSFARKMRLTFKR